MALLSEDEIEQRLAMLKGWELKGIEIERTYKLKDFVEAMEFVNRVAEAAEERNHHPDINISWNTVTMTLLTHSQGGLTKSDFELAAKIDELA